MKKEVAVVILKKKHSELKQAEIILEMYENGVRELREDIENLEAIIERKLIMDKVYEFWYNECIYESASQCMSLHKTREGAEKAMERHKKETEDEWQWISIPDGMRWGVSEWIIEE